VFDLGAAERICAFPLVQDPIVPAKLSGNLLQGLPPVGFIAKQAAFTLADQLLKANAVLWRGRRKDNLADEFAANI
jgi:hypothetical protein